MAKGPKISPVCPVCGSTNIRKRDGAIALHPRTNPRCEGSAREWVDAVNAGIVKAVGQARTLLENVPLFRRNIEEEHQSRLVALDAQEAWAKAVLAAHGEGGK